MASNGLQSISEASLEVNRESKCPSLLLVGIIHSTCEGIELPTGEYKRFEFDRHRLLEPLLVSWAQTLISRHFWPRPSFPTCLLGMLHKLRSDYHRNSEKIKRKCCAGLSITARQAVSDGNESGGMMMIMVIRPNSTPFPLFIGERRIFMAPLQIAEQIRLIQTLLQLVDIETMRASSVRRVETLQTKSNDEIASFGRNCLWQTKNA